jgi:hypothetical protein
VSEVTLFLRGELVGVAVDVHPRRTGGSVRADLDSGAGVFTLSILFATSPDAAERSEKTPAGVKRRP